jgi:hypothetical protein
MPKFKKIVAQFALSTAVIGGALAMGAVAANASCSGGCDNGGRDGIANGNRGGTGGIAQDNFIPFERNFPVFVNHNRTPIQNHEQNNWNNHNMWNQQGFWNQGLFADRLNDTSGFGLVAKDVALGFQDKTNRDNNWFNNNWWQHNNLFNNRDQLHNNWFNNNPR